MGHVYPGATVPFGMVQLSPDSDTIPFLYEGIGDVYRIMQITIPDLQL